MTEAEQPVDIEPLVSPPGNVTVFKYVCEGGSCHLQPRTLDSENAQPLVDRSPEADVSPSTSGINQAFNRILEIVNFRGNPPANDPIPHPEPAPILPQ